MSRSPNVRTKQDFQCFPPHSNDAITLPQHSFVKPVEEKYVPKHVIESVPKWRYNLEKDVFCHTKFGFVLIPRDILEAV